MVPSRLESTSGQSRLFLSLAKWSSLHHCSFITPSFIVVSISAPTTVTMVAVVCLLWMFLRYVSRDVVSYYTVLLGRWSLHLVHCWSQSLWLWFWSCKNGLAYITGTRTNRPLLAAREYPRESVQLHLQTRGRQANAGLYMWSVAKAAMLRRLQLRELVAHQAEVWQRRWASDINDTAQHRPHMHSTSCS